MFSEVRKRAKKSGQPPGTPIYTGDKKNTITRISVVTFDAKHAEVIDCAQISEAQHLLEKPKMTTWVNVEGLGNTVEIGEIAKYFRLHALTVEDILNVGQRPKVDSFDHYVYVTLRALNWNSKSMILSTEQISFILGENFIISFQEYDTTRFNAVKKRIDSIAKHKLKEHGPDFLLYRFIDEIVDEYFIVLNAIGDDMEIIEQKIILNPTPQHARIVYRMKNQLVMLRKAIWPMRDMVNHLLNDQNIFISSFMRVYIRDLYDHIVQSIDTLETFRDMLSSILDMYFSSITNRMNEIMKTLTIISTIFIPITAIASIYGMNFVNLPGINSRWGYLIVFILMIMVTVNMLIYFKNKKWF